MEKHDHAILTLDPGKTTGMAFHDYQTGDKWFDQKNFTDTTATVVGLAAALHDRLIIVAESFIITPNTAKNSQAPWSLEVIGVARYASQAYCGRDLRLQSPGAAKRFSSDDRLRLVGYYLPGKGHANDASRHLLLFEATQGYLEEDRLREMAVIS